MNTATYAINDVYVRQVMGIIERADKQTISSTTSQVRHKLSDCFRVRLDHGVKLLAINRTIAYLVDNLTNNFNSSLHCTTSPHWIISVNCLLQITIHIEAHLKDYLVISVSR